MAGRTVKLISAVLQAVVAIACFTAIAAVAQQPVVVELFTSEGCSSCPPADALLSQLSKQRNSTSVELILLEEHVEYWNGQGWNDRFSGPTFTQRQYEYEKQFHLVSAYTPQVIIDGHLQTSGGNAAAIQQRLAEAAHAPKSATVALNFTAPDRLQVTATDPSNAKLRVLLAITEDNLTTKVGGGENGGRVLKHDAVVRELRTIGTLSNGRFEKTVNVPDKSDWKKDDLRAIVLLSDESDNSIRGAASVPFSTHATAATGR
jgi:hypothetical protein